MNSQDTRLLPSAETRLVDLVALGPEHFDTVSRWLSNEKACCWLDFGGGRQILSKRELIIRLLNPHTHARLFTLRGDDRPLGLVCLNNADDLMGAAEVWVVRDTSSEFLRDVCTTYPASVVRNALPAAVIRLFATAFLDLQRHVVGSWVVESNVKSIRIHEIVGMRKTGLQRGRHVMGGQRYDRWLYDITRDEFEQLYPEVLSELGRSFRSDSQFRSAVALPAATRPEG